ncbi:hypothetical protein ACFLVU_04645 [Chloroflexota bacterium]
MHKRNSLTVKLAYWLIIILFIFINGCSSFTPPEECPFTGTADEILFSQKFTRMELIYSDGSLPEVDGDSGSIFSTNDSIDILVISEERLEFQICISERKGGGKVVYNESHTVSQGENNIRLGSFSNNPYVVRIGVNNILVRNLPFAVE